MTASEAVVGRYVEVDGQPVYYESGAADGPTLLCIHTAGRDGRQWQDYIAHYADTYRVLVPDLPGHHKSWPSRDKPCLDEPLEIATFLWAFLDMLGAGAAVLAGCSLGGNLVLAMAQQRPEQTRAVISFEGTDYVGRDVAPFALLDHPAVRVADWYYERIDGLIGSATPEERRAFIKWTARQLIDETQYADLVAYGRCDLRADMHRITCPCLLVRGGEDWIVTQEMVDSAAERLVNAARVRRELLPGTGHFAHYEQPDRCIALMDGFLADAGLPVPPP